MNKFLEEHGFVSVGEKVAGTGLLLMIACGLLILAVGFIGAAIFAPILVGSLFLFFGSLFLIFKFSGNLCPICNERVKKIDAHLTDEGRFCHEWCAHILERTDDQ